MDPTEIKLKPGAILQVFENSKHNGGEYRQPTEAYAWRWPTGTFLQKRMAQLRLNKAYGVEER